MDFGDHYWGLYRDYYIVIHSLLSTRQACEGVCACGTLGFCRVLVRELVAAVLPRPMTV